MGDLPEDRVLTHAPFTAAGIDVFGPFETKVNRKTTKKWAILSTCFSTRAVCILPLRSLDSASVVRALMKMNAMFPGVKKLYSDNGSNFRGADREMREALTKWKEENVNAELQPQGIEWVFGPARCGSAGGVWERMIGLTKNLLKSVIKGQILDAGTWETYLFATMAIMNRRPLTPAAAGDDDWMVLSPAHFLYPHLFTNSATSIMSPSSETTPVLRDTWKKTRQIIDEF